MRKGVLTFFLGFNISLTAVAGSHPNLSSAYAAIGFDPTVPGNAPVVLFSDPHMLLDPNAGHTYAETTNLDLRLVREVNSMSPPPAKILVSGDVSTTFSVVPGMVPGGDWYLTYGTNEMLYWLSAINAFTNLARTNILWVPGNHDQDPRETNAEMFCRIFPNMPPYQSFNLAGVKFMLLNGGNCNEPSQSEKEWLRAQVAATSPTQTVVALIHQPPFNGISTERGGALMLRDSFADWPARWWALAGHAHCSSSVPAVYNVGRSNLAMDFLGTVNTNVFNGLTHMAGFMVMCLSNGIAGRIYYHFDTGDYEVLAEPDWEHPIVWRAVFETVPGLLWRRLKTPGSPPEVLSFKATFDAGYWYYSATEVQWGLALGLHGNQASHFLVAGAGLPADGTMEFSADRLTWSPPQSLSQPSNAVYTFLIPEEVRAVATGYARYRSVCGDGNLAGWGLATTNAVALITFPQMSQTPDQQIMAGRVLLVTNVAVDPYSPPDVLRFSLLSAPASAVLDQRSGVFSWRPPVGNAPGIVPVQLRVSDSSTPVMSATQTFWIMVVRPEAALTSFRLEQGNFSFKVNGEPQLNYTILGSTNLRDWISLFSTNPAQMPFEVVVPNAAGSPQFFYRVAIGP